MSTFTKESLNLLRDRIDLIEVISSHVQLKRTGGYYKGLCPFHTEKSPSFVVQKGDSHYHCFGCGAHGDALAFMMNYLKLSFVEAVETLAAKYQVQLDHADPDEAKKFNKQKSEEKEIKTALDQVANFYHFYLLHTPDGQAALEYLYERGIDLDFIHTFKVGYAPADSRLQFDYFQKEKLTPFILEKAAITKKDAKGKVYPFFSKRITFPITDNLGRIIGFSARKINEETFGPKYVNTSETAVFKKSKVLFGLSYSRRRIAKEHRAVIVEGQIDALRLIQEGLNITVAGQGTAFGQEHVNQLVKLGIHRVDLAFDGDNAGKEAAIKVGHMFQKEGVDVSVICFPPGLDPDGVLCEGGIEAFMGYMDRGIDYLNFLVDFHSENVNTQTPAGKNQLVKMISDKIHEWEHPLMVHEGLKKLANILQVPENVIDQKRGSAPPIAMRTQMSIGSVNIDPDRILEVDLLRWIALVGQSDQSLVELICKNIHPDDFLVAACKRIYTKCLEVFEAEQSLDLIHIITSLEDTEERLFLSEILSKKVQADRAQEGVTRGIEKILQRNWLLKRESIKTRIQRGGHTEDQLLSLAKEFDELKKNPPALVE
ncbi:MAG: DNA primase [Chlamydiia bacterium]|nr:DNA primase [Chlamydiia bacterium]